MQSSIPLGRILGIPISANWSLVALMALLIVDLGDGVFPQSDPGLSSSLYLLMGAISAVCFIGGVLVHEVGHAVQARREGMRIHSITLWLFGGVARFEGFFPSGAAEVRIALAGPAVSLVIGGSLLGVAQISALPVAVQVVVWWLGWINIFLGAFNMLPALPLDGGRTLRGAAWAMTRDLARATRVAAQVSRLVAFGVIALGITLALGYGDPLGGIWLAAIGIFVMQAATFEGRVASAPLPADPRRIRDVMRGFTASIPPEAPVDSFATAIHRAPPGTAYPVIDDNGVVVGLVLREVVAALAPERFGTAHARDLMIGRGELPSLEPDTPLSDAREAIAHARWGRALVIDHDILLGMVGLTDLVAPPLAL